MFKSSVPQSSPSLGMPTHKFVEGTVYQLARVLYAVHRDNESQPADAIHEAIKTFGDDLDRNTILQSARISAEALNRKKLLLFKTQKTATTLTVFEQAESLKKSRIASMDRELVNMHEAALVHEDTEGSAQQDTLAMWAEYNERHDIRSGLKQEVRDAIYSDEEISLATQRLQRIEQIDNRRGEAVDTTAAQMKNVWRQLVQALLLQKSRGHGDPLISFENTPSASKEPIARVSRTECGKLNRLSLQEGELIRSFAARCRAEERYCNWIRAHHASTTPTDRATQAQIDSMSRTVDEDIDSSLFAALAGALPISLAYMRSNVEKQSKLGTKFSALRLELEGEADFLKEHSAQHPKVSFLDTQSDHSAHVALSTRISKDPKGAPVSENITESYQKQVSTNFKLKKDKRRRGSDDDSDTKEDDVVSFIDKIKTPIVDPVVATLWSKLLEIDSRLPTIAPVNLPCFDFQGKGNCARGASCPYLHDPKTQRSSKPKDSSSHPPPRKRSISPARHETKRYRSRSPRPRSPPQKSVPPRAMEEGEPVSTRF